MTAEQERRPALTGEQLDPETGSHFAFWEHIYRYRFAAARVRGKTVLDVACGEGYGTAALAGAGAVSVVGLDVSHQVCRHARRKYLAPFATADAQRIPLLDQSVDVAVSFETLEHLPSPSAFLGELHRVLKPGGTLIVSTPNIEVYGVGNPFHCSEVTEEQFESLLAAARFVRPSFYSQSPRSAAWWSLRSLATFEPPWIHIKGAWRLREYLTKLVAPRLLKQNIDAFRRRPVDAVLSGDRALMRFLNPYLVRPRTQAFRETPTYLVAVAERAVE